MRCEDSTLHCCLCRWRKGLQSKEYVWLPEARKEKDMDSLLERPGRNTALVLAQRDPCQTSDLQHCKVIRLYCLSH